MNSMCCIYSILFLHNNIELDTTKQMKKAKKEKKSIDEGMLSQFVFSVV